MKTADCEITLEVNVDCPYCGHFQDVKSEVLPVEPDIFDCASDGVDLDIEVTCEECNKDFELKRIYY